MVAVSHAAQAHGIGGNRVFPGTLAFDDHKADIGSRIFEYLVGAQQERP
jgi:hypothetical protein